MNEWAKEWLTERHGMNEWMVRSACVCSHIHDDGHDTSWSYFTLKSDYYFVFYFLFLSVLQKVNLIRFADFTVYLHCLFKIVLFLHFPPGILVERIIILYILWFNLCNKFNTKNYNRIKICLI